MANRARRRTTVRRSPIHGRGVYALVDLEPGELLLQFRGIVTTWEQVLARDAGDDGGGEGTTYLIAAPDGTVIDCARGGNSTRYLNHSCEPNCETVEVRGRVHLATLTRVRAGEELLIDYALIVDDPDDPGVRAWYACHCGARRCRATMVAAR